MSNRKNWTREETILAFELYCRTPFGKIGNRNPDIITLSIFLGRTANAVSLKMHNLAHYDPSLIARGVSGMKNGSKLDPMIFKEFYNNTEELIYQANRIRREMQGEVLYDGVDMSDIDMIPTGEYREQVVKRRVGQYYFRLAVLNSYNNRCCVTGLRRPELLIASHIKPWNVSDEKTERTNPQNGLCLNALHDKAFDRGLITITSDYKIITSSKLSEATMDEETNRWLKNYDKKEIVLPDRFLPAKGFIEYHNDMIFQG